MAATISNSAKVWDVLYSDLPVEPQEKDFICRAGFDAELPDEPQDLALRLVSVICSIVRKHADF
jgi:hypothetical protein